MRSGGTEQKLRIAKGTYIAHADGSEAPARAIRRGVHIEFDGAATGNGVVAASVRLSDRRMDAGVLGAGANVPAGRRVMLRTGPDQRVRVIATDATRIVKADGSRGTIADLKAGTAALVDGVGGARRLVATTIRLLASRDAILRVEGTVVKATAKALIIDRGATNVRVNLAATTLGSRVSGAPMVATNLRPDANVLVVGVRGEKSATARFVLLR